jgi:hypothetical protein
VPRAVTNVCEYAAHPVFVLPSLNRPDTCHFCSFVVLCFDNDDVRLLKSAHKLYWHVSPLLVRCTVLWQCQCWKRRTAPEISAYVLEPTALVHTRWFRDSYVVQHSYIVTWLMYYEKVGRRVLLRDDSTLSQCNNAIIARWPVLAITLLSSPSGLGQ